MDITTLERLVADLRVRLDLFALCEIGADWRLRPGALDFMTCYIVAHGNGFLEIPGKRSPIGPGTLIVVPPKVSASLSGAGLIMHDIRSDECSANGADGLLLFAARKSEASLLLGCASIMAASFGGSLGLFDSLREPLILTAGDAMNSASMDSFLEELAHPSFGSMVIAECMMKQAVVLLFRQQLGADGPSLLTDCMCDQRIVRTAAAMTESPEEKHTVASLAEIAGMSRSSFLSRFFEQYGKTPGEFLLTIRMGSAARLLRTTDLPIKCVAAHVGYASRSYFSRAFRHKFRADPSAYREQSRESEAQQRAHRRPSLRSLEPADQPEFIASAG
ncbi:MAG TPA: AraC family transcriptional regulator [Sphingomicrobium sp.]|nr:AraC family transcriptional regulator [Sphingomicrobium sp.]